MLSDGCCARFAHRSTHAAPPMSVTKPERVRLRSSPGSPPRPYEARSLPAKALQDALSDKGLTSTRVGCRGPLPPPGSLVARSCQRHEWFSCVASAGCGGGEWTFAGHTAAHHNHLCNFQDSRTAGSGDAFRTTSVGLPPAESFNAVVNAVLVAYKHVTKTSISA